jgi:hypothetical protein
MECGGHHALRQHKDILYLKASDGPGKGSLGAAEAFGDIPATNSASSMLSELTAKMRSLNWDVEFDAGRHTPL